ncbi:MAG TPA: histidine kinase [Xanthomonadaceae bacterium]|nr:histidine kinase [Xanthomonadaceae bacterium]
MHVQQMLEQAHQLPSIPKLVQELLQALDDPNVDASRIAAKLQLDQALSAKVLRLANSSFYGGTRKISAVNDAVVMLGVDALRTMVAAGGVVSAFKAPEGFDLRAFWRRSFMVAGLCRWLVRRGKLCSLNAETAFTAGLMHDVGNLLMHTLDAERMREVDAAVAAGAPRGDAEQMILGYTSVEIGGALARHWHFPDALCEAVVNHPAPMAARVPNEYAGVVHVARVAQLLLSGQQPLEGLFTSAAAPVASWLELDAEVLAPHWDEAAGLGQDIDVLLT